MKCVMCGKEDWATYTVDGVTYCFPCAQFCKTLVLAVTDVTDSIRSNEDWKWFINNMTEYLDSGTSEQKEEAYQAWRDELKRERFDRDTLEEISRL